MLSEVIHSRHSYSAMPLAGQQIDQRSVPPGPLVVYSPITRSTDYTFLQNYMEGCILPSCSCPKLFLRLSRYI